MILVLGILPNIRYTFKWQITAKVMAIMSVSEQRNETNIDRQETTIEQRWYTHHRYLYLLAKIILFTAVLILFWRLFSVVSTVLMPAVVAMIFAYIFDPLIDIFERRGFNRTLTIAALVCILIIIVSLLMIIILPAFINLAIETIQKLPGWLTVYFHKLEDFARNTLGYSGAEISGVLRKEIAGVQGAVKGLLGGIGSSVSTVISTLLVPLFFFYFVRDFDRIKFKPLLLIPPRFHDYVISRAQLMDSKVGGWIRGQIQVACLLAILYSIGLTIAGVKHGFVIGIVAGLFNVVPFVGSALGISLSVLMVLLAHDSWLTLFAALGVFAVIVPIDSYFITPRLVGAKVGFHPLMIISVVLVGGSLFGLVGMLFAVPFTAAISVLLEDAIAVWRKSNFFK
ncbi:MAG: AI-2E family transporter [Deltaproteobacteria bacterium]|nr:AI-2E family transporter [Deltaproteobacteria bacterium]